MDNTEDIEFRLIITVGQKVLNKQYMFDKRLNELEKLAIWTVVQKTAEEQIERMTKSVPVK